MLPLKLTDAAYLAIVTALGYLFSYAYETGYLSYYGLGDKYVNLTIQVIIRNSVILFFLLGVVVGLALLLYDMLLLKDSGNRIIKIDRIVWVITSLILPIVTLSELNIINNRVAFPLYCTLLFLTFLLWTIVFFKNLIMEEKNENKSKKYIFTKHVMTIMLFILTFSIVHGFGLSLGNFFAETKNKYNVLDGMPDYVVISTYSDKFMVVPYDDEKKTFSKKYIVMPLENVEFENKEIGPLTPEK